MFCISISPKSVLDWCISSVDKKRTGNEREGRKEEVRKERGERGEEYMFCMGVKKTM